MPLMFCFTSLNKIEIRDGFESRLYAVVRDLFNKPGDVNIAFPGLFLKTGNDYSWSAGTNVYLSIAE